MMNNSDDDDTVVSNTSDNNKIQLQNNNDILSTLQEYMLTSKRINTSLKCNNITEKKINSVKEQTSYNRNKMTKFERNKTQKSIQNNEQYTFYPKEKDQLFWCFYIMKNGLENYKQLGEVNIINEKKIKIEYVEKIRKNKGIIKNKKFCPLYELENFLVNEEKIDINTFLSLCVLENINVMYIYKKMFYEIISIEDETPYILTKSNNNGTILYGCEINIQKNKISDYRDKYYSLENISKPIKALSSYKLEDLQNLCVKIGLETIHSVTNKPKIKKELYETLVQYFEI